MLALIMEAGTRRLPHHLPLVVAMVMMTTLMTRAAYALHFPHAHSRTAYARFGKWNACHNASIEFEFRTRQTEGLLMYTDDNGHYDFLQVVTKSGRVNVVLNLVNGRDAHVELDAGRDVTDGRWHRVEIARNRMSTTLTVDGVSTSALSFGSDFEFGNMATNNDVFFGGLPDLYNDIEALHTLSLASALYEPRYQGDIRNIMYRNCTCARTRAEFLEGAGVSLSPPEKCTERNPCRNGCVCVSTDTDPSCDCADLTCDVTQQQGDHPIEFCFRFPVLGLSTLLLLGASRPQGQ